MDSLNGAARRGWNRLRLIPSANDSLPRDFRTESEDGSQLPMANVFVRRNGRIRPFGASELLFRAHPTGHPAPA